jgi:hypothetical protein
MRRKGIVAMALGALIVLVGLAAVAGTSQANTAPSCTARASLPFYGTATAKAGDLVTFTVDRVPNSPPAAAAAGPAPAPGQDQSGYAPSSNQPDLSPGSPIAVRYGSGTAKYLQVGKQYSVSLYGPGLGGTYTSSVGSGCGEGTVYADGTAIDTSLVSIRGIHTGGLVTIGIGAIVLSLGAAGWVLRSRRRKSERRAIARWEATSDQVASIAGIENGPGTSV